MVETECCSYGQQLWPPGSSRCFHVHETRPSCARNTCCVIAAHACEATFLRPLCKYNDDWLLSTAYYVVPKARIKIIETVTQILRITNPAGNRHKRTLQGTKVQAFKMKIMELEVSVWSDRAMVQEVRCRLLSAGAVFSPRLVQLWWTKGTATGYS